MYKTLQEKRKNLFIKQKNFAVVNKYEIEVTIFENGHSLKYIKDLDNNRCYKETESESLKGFELVKKRIKAKDFEAILNTCTLI